MADYSLNGLRWRAWRAIESLVGKRQDSILELYLSTRRKRKLPVLAICGPSRAGKDTVAALLAKQYALRYSGSLSKTYLPYIAHMVGDTQESVYQQRHRYADFWKYACAALRRCRPHLFLQQNLIFNDTVVGIRDAEEFRLARCCYVDVSVWVYNPAVPGDPTLSYSMSDCDMILRNDGSLQELEQNVNRLCSLLCG